MTGKGNTITPEGDWPEHYPENCPPGGATATLGTAYRFIMGDAPEPTDFESDIVKQRHANADLCLRCGITVFRDEADLQTMRDLFKGFREKNAARGDLTPAHGAWLNTGGAVAGHHTWWIAPGIDAHELFEAM